MGDHLRVHPVHDPESATYPNTKPTAPLVSRDSSRSENGNPDRHQQPPIVRTIPYAPTKPPKKRSCCKRFLCWTLCLTTLPIILLAILAAIIYFGFQPRIPNYSVDSLRITQFNLGIDNSLSATFTINITAINPNTRIGIYYENGSHISVMYRETELSRGSLPVFYQGHRNTTLLSINVPGHTRDASGLLQSIQMDQQNTGSILLIIQARVPVRIRLGRLRLTRWKFLVRCSLSVDSLAQDNVIRIRDSRCNLRFRL